MTTLPDEQVLRELLADGAQWDPLYPSGSTDHLPMALQALWRLGATAQQMHGFQRDYATKLVPLAQHPPIELDGAGWQRWFGDWRIYRPLRAHLIADIAARGREAVLREWLPQLVVCAAIDALHPLIRVGYGIEQGVDAEIAAGLAYWAAQYVPGVPLTDQREPVAGGAAALFARVRNTQELTGIKFAQRGFGHRLQRVTAAPAFAQVCAWRDGDVGLREFVREVARIYLATNDFFALHMVTGTQALALLAPYIDDQQVLLDRAWQTLAATYLIIGAPAYGFTPRTVAAPDDARLVAAGLRAAKDPEHVIKLAHSAREAFTQWQMPEHAMILEGIVRRQLG